MRVSLMAKIELGYRFLRLWKKFFSKIFNSAKQPIAIAELIEIFEKKKFFIFQSKTRLS